MRERERERIIRSLCVCTCVFKKNVKEKKKGFKRLCGVA